jgi:predicted TIM-barrel fold metal-dependent hydrolase
VDFLKECGVTGIVFNMWQGVYADSEEDLDQANQEALALYEEDPGFFYPGAVIHPLFPAASERWLAAFRERDLRWVGELVPYRNGIDFGQPGWRRLLEICRENGQIVQLHGCPSVVEAARALPDLKIVSAHIFPELLADLEALPNVWLDLGGAEGGQRLGRMELALAHFGPDRLLWGTDFLVFDPAAFHVRALHAFPSVADRAKIFATNVLDLLASAGGVPAFQPRPRKETSMREPLACS